MLTSGTSFVARIKLEEGRTRKNIGSRGSLLCCRCAGDGDPAFFQGPLYGVSATGVRCTYESKPSQDLA